MSPRHGVLNAPEHCLRDVAADNSCPQSGETEREHAGLDSYLENSVGQEIRINTRPRVALHHESRQIQGYCVEGRSAHARSTASSEDGTSIVFHLGAASP